MGTTASRRRESMAALKFLPETACAPAYACNVGATCLHGRSNTWCSGKQPQLQNQPLTASHLSQAKLHPNKNVANEGGRYEKQHVSWVPSKTYFMWVALLRRFPCSAGMLEPPVRPSSRPHELSYAGGISSLSTIETNSGCALSAAGRLGGIGGRAAQNGHCDLGRYRLETWIILQQLRQV